MTGLAAPPSAAAASGPGSTGSSPGTASILASVAPPGSNAAIRIHAPPVRADNAHSSGTLFGHARPPTRNRVGSPAGGARGGNPSGTHARPMEVAEAIRQGLMHV